jgi:hypothetical protein
VLTIHAGFVDRDDMGMVEAGRSFTLAQEPQECRVGEREIGSGYLHCHEAKELHVVGEEYQPESAPPEWPEESEMTHGE